MNISDRRYGLLLNLPGLFIGLLGIVLPAGLLLYISFLRYDNVRPIVFIGFRNYQKLFTDYLFWISLQQVIIFSIGTTIVTFAGGMVLALSIKKISRGIGLFYTLMIMLWAIPAVVSGIAWKWMFGLVFGIISAPLMAVGLIGKPLSIYNNFTLAMIGVIIADSWTHIPIMGIILLAALRRIPREFYDIAQLNGLEVIPGFIHVTLPLIRRPMVVGLLITLVLSLRTLDTIMPLTAGGPGRATYMLSYYIWDKSIKTLNFGFGAAAGIVLFLITVGCILAAFAYFRRISSKE